VPGTLYIVATPIGNSEDITGRAKRILAEVDIIAAEDTRTTQKLLNMLGIKNKMVSNHKFNEKKQSEFLLTELMKGKNAAIVCDAGTPCISDPGYLIVKNAAANGINTIGICGASAVITALSISGFDAASFAFYGFFPRQDKAKNEVLQRIINSGIPVSVFFESPKRMEKTLRIIANSLADSIHDAEVCLCNDLTKLYEKIYRGTPQEVLEELAGNQFAEKGEYTIVIRTKTIAHKPIPDAVHSCESMLIDYIIKNGCTIKDAIKDLHEEHRGKISKKELYNASLNLKELLTSIFYEGGPC
jgi:16S rRNA (cytidine1402-2'-O)-methyltransferase